MKKENLCILPLNRLVEMRVDGIMHRFRVSRHYPCMGYEFKCISEDPTMIYENKIISFHKVKEARDKGLIKIIFRKGQKRK